jgi:hypothetical protein
MLPSFCVKILRRLGVGSVASLTFIKSHYPMINQISRRLSQASAAHRATGTSQTEMGAAYTLPSTLKQQEEQGQEK